MSDRPEGPASDAEARPDSTHSQAVPAELSKNRRLARSIGPRACYRDRLPQPLGKFGQVHCNARATQTHSRSKEQTPPRQSRPRDLQIESWDDAFANCLD